MVFINYLSPVRLIIEFVFCIMFNGMIWHWSCDAEARHCILFFKNSAYLYQTTQFLQYDLL